MGCFPGLTWLPDTQMSVGTECPTGLHQPEATYLSLADHLYLWAARKTCDCSHKLELFYKCELNPLQLGAMMPSFLEFYEMPGLISFLFHSLLFCLAGTSFPASAQPPQTVPGLRLKAPSVCTERLSCPSYKGETYSKWGTSKVKVGDKCLDLESASALILVSIF